MSICLFFFQAHHPGLDKRGNVAALLLWFLLLSYTGFKIWVKQKFATKFLFNKDKNKCFGRKHFCFNIFVFHFKWSFKTKTWNFVIYNMKVNICEVLYFALPWIVALRKPQNSLLKYGWFGKLSQPNPTPTQHQLNLTRLRLDIIITPNLRFSDNPY